MIPLYKKLTDKRNNLMYHINLVKCFGWGGGGEGGGALHFRQGESFRANSVINQPLLIPPINSIKVIRYTCRGNNSTISASLLSRGQLLKE